MKRPISVESAMPDFSVFVPEMTSIVWSGIFASTITLLGVFVSDWKNSKRLQQQLKFTERENERARQMALRKEVYLPVAGALTKLQSHLFSLGTVAPDNSANNPMIQFSEAAAKLAMVAGTETAILAQELVAEYARAYATLAKLGMAVSSANTDASTHRAWKDKAQGNVDRVNHEIAKFLESAKLDQVRFTALQESLSGFNKEFTYWAGREGEALQRAALETNKFIREAIELVMPLSGLVTQLLIRVRAELGQDTDELEFTRAMENGQAKSMAGLRDFLAQLDALATGGHDGSDAVDAARASTVSGVPAD